MLEAGLAHHLTAKASLKGAPPTGLDAVFRLGDQVFIAEAKRWGENGPGTDPHGAGPSGPVGRGPSRRRAGRGAMVSSLASTRARRSSGRRTACGGTARSPPGSTAGGPATMIRPPAGWAVTAPEGRTGPMTKPSRGRSRRARAH
ncbi:hypothetical protein GCM10009578_091630 [Streptomyces rhizosphaericus]